MSYLRFCCLTTQTMWLLRALVATSFGLWCFCEDFVLRFLLIILCGLFGVPVFCRFGANNLGGLLLCLSFYHHFDPRSAFISMLPVSTVRELPSPLFPVGAPLVSSCCTLCVTGVSSVDDVYRGPGKFLLMKFRIPPLSPPPNTFCPWTQGGSPVLNSLCFPFWKPGC